MVPHLAGAECLKSSVGKCPLSEQEVTAPYQRCKNGTSSSLADAHIKKGLCLKDRVRQVDCYLTEQLLRLHYKQCCLLHYKQH